MEGEEIAKLNDLLAEIHQNLLDPAGLQAFDAYLSLILRWNARTNLTAIRDRDGILSRHFVESIVCARAIPTEVKTLLDFGSGAGFPGVPIALCRPEVAVTLAESQGKKAAFLREAVRVLGLAVTVHGGRAETLPIQFDCVAMRAVDKMHEAVPVAEKLVAQAGWLVVMTTHAQLDALQHLAGADFDPFETLPLPGVDRGVIALAQRKSKQA